MAAQNSALGSSATNSAGVDTSNTALEDHTTLNDTSDEESGDGDQGDINGRESLTDRMKTSKDIFGHRLFPASNTDLPDGISLEEICRSYPNHLQGRILKRFKEARWSGRRIQSAIPNRANQERYRLSKSGQAPSQPHSVFTKRLSMLDEEIYEHTKQMSQANKARKAREKEQATAAEGSTSSATSDS